MMARYASLLFFAWSAIAQPPPAKTPVLLELFTSLGCSSCPPADKLLADIDRQQPIPSARLIVLSEHVDYWNTPIWSDPFSSVTYTQRQQAYSLRLGAEAYTPQLVVDGTTVVVGSSWPKAADAIKQSLSSVKIPIHLTATRADGKVHFAINAGPNSTGKKAAIFLVLAYDHANSHIGGGENAGRDLSEVAVTYLLRDAGKLEPGSTFQRSLSVSLPGKSLAGDTRAIVFARRSDTEQIIGADQILY